MPATKLYLFVMHNAITNLPFIDHQPLHVLPGRKEKIQALKATGAQIGLVSMAGGVAIGKATEEEAEAEVRGIAQRIQADHWMVSFGYPTPKWGYEKYGTPVMLEYRFPRPGMIKEIMAKAGVDPTETMLVGTREEDRDAAKNAKCLFTLAKDFFANYEELLSTVYNLFQSAVKRLNDEKLYLCFFADGGGEIGWNEYTNFIEWKKLSEAPALIEAAIAEEEAREEARKAHTSADDFDPFLDSDDLP